MANSAQPAPINLTVDKNYDSEFCGSIPLHLVNLIQPYGYLLMLDGQLTVVQASENADELFGVPLEEVLGQSLASYLPDEQFQMLQEKTFDGDGRDAIPVSLTFSAGKHQQGYHAVLHRQEHHFLLELEPATKSPAEVSFTKVFEQIKTLTTKLKAAADTMAAATVAAQEMKAFSGFDRVLLYQFDPQWNGIVIAEAKAESMDSLLDLRFPASDVPKQARDLYFKNPYRMIPDRDYTPVRLLPVINPLTHRFTDLSATNLRGVAPVHLEYLKNLSIVASLSLPLIMEDRLWGLVSCHHRSARLPGYEVRSALELMAGIVSAQLAAKEKEQSIGRKARLGALHARLVSQLYATEDFSGALLAGPVSVLDLLSLTGAVLVYDGEIRTSGQVPPTAAIQELVAWLRRNHPETRFVTDTLPKAYPASRTYKEVASGLIALAINAPQGEYLLGLRPEVLQTVSWGGDPNQAIQMEADGKTYHPRNSFATYRETIRYTASPWEPEQVAAGEALQHALLARIVQEKH